MPFTKKDWETGDGVLCVGLPEKSKFYHKIEILAKDRVETRVHSAIGIGRESWPGGCFSTGVFPSVDAAFESSERWKFFYIGKETPDSYSLIKTPQNIGYGEYSDLFAPFKGRVIRD